MKENLVDKYFYDPETGKTECILEDLTSGKKYSGIAICHEEDKDWQSEKIGNAIACNRAVIAYYNELKRTTKIEKEALNNVYKTYLHRSNFNNDYDNPYVRILRKKIWSLHNEMQEINEIIQNIEHVTTNYINAKENYHKKIDAMRKTK